jgi:hypothetical protein
MEKEFVPYELAVKLKELGFDEPCFGYYYNKQLSFGARTSYGEVIEAPTFSQAFRWFRDKGYDVKVQKESDGLYFGFYWTGAAWIIVGNGTYEEAELACLDKLIEIVENKSE